MPAGRRRRSRPSGAASRGPAGSSCPFERTSPPDVDEADEEEHHEDDRFHESEGSNRLQEHGDGVEEDHLDVEQDEQHRHEVEGDAEAEVACYFRWQTALVRLTLHLPRPLRADELVRLNEGEADKQPEEEEDKDWEVRLQHGERVIQPLVTTCYIVLKDAI